MSTGGFGKLEDGFAVHVGAEVGEVGAVLDAEGNGVGRVFGGKRRDFGDGGGELLVGKVGEDDAGFLAFGDFGNERSRNADFEVHSEFALDIDDRTADADDLIDVGGNAGDEAIVRHGEGGVLHVQFGGLEGGFGGFLVGDGGVEAGFAGIAGFEEFLGAAEFLGRLEGLGTGSLEVGFVEVGIEFGEELACAVAATGLGEDLGDAAGDLEAEFDGGGGFGLAGETAFLGVGGIGNEEGDDGARNDGGNGFFFFAGGECEESEWEKHRAETRRRGGCFF